MPANPRTDSSCALQRALLVCGLSLLIGACSGEREASQEVGRTSDVAVGAPEAGEGVALEREPQVAATDGADPTRRFAVWHTDFPVAIEFSPSQAGRWYNRSPREMLEQVAANLSGTCTRNAWLLAKEFFARVSRDDAMVLIEALDRAMQTGANDTVETTLDAMSRVGDPRFAPAILRALSRPTIGAQTAAMRALTTCGTPEALMEAKAYVGRMHGSAQSFYFEALCRVLDGGRAAEQIHELVTELQLAGLHAEIARHATGLAPGDAFAALRSMWQNPPPGLGPTLIGLRHAAGDESGTVRLQELLRDESPLTRAAGLGALRFGGQAAFSSRVLELTTDPDAGVRLATLSVLAKLPEPAVVGALENLALDEAAAVRQGALAMLVQRGELGVLDDLLEALRTATGSNLEALLADLVAARDPRAIPRIVERMAGLPPIEQRGFVQSIARMQVAESFAPLRDLFLAPPTNYAGGGPSAAQFESRAYLALLFVNARGAEAEIVELFEQIDRADYVRRGHLLGTLASIGVDREDAEIRKRVYGALRDVALDPNEIPQMRLAALDYWKRNMDVADVTTLRRSVAKEDVPMQRALNDFLLEYF